MMRANSSVTLLLLALPAFAAIDGTVSNGTTGKPVASLSVALIEPSQSGMDALETAVSDASGKFALSKSPKGPGLIQVTYQGVTYTKVLMPGVPTTGTRVIVYDATKSPVAKVSQHMILLQPNGTDVSVNETLLFTGDPKLTFNDPDNGTVRFYVPPELKGDIGVSINAGSVPIQRQAEKTKQPNIYKVDYPMKPGETRVDISYSVPETNPAVYAGRVLHKEGKTRLVVPSGVALKGEGIAEIGKEPQSQATIYDLTSPDYKVEISGTGSLTAPEAETGEDNGQPKIEQAKPHIYNNLPMLAGLCFGILGLGAFLLATKK